MLNKIVKKILQSRVYDVAIETPLSPAPQLSHRLSNTILLKREDLQPVYSFKIRGAYNKMAQLTDQQRHSGVIAASAGNHAQGVAFSAQKMGISATIVMPKTTPDIKVKSVKRYGAKIVLHGNTYNEAYDHAIHLAETHGYTVVHPYDDPDVMAGQGTVALELLRQCRHIDAIFVPVGGGGLIGGMAAYIKYVNPTIQVIGVEPADAACLAAAMAAGERVILPEVGIFVDGVAVKQVGDAPFQVAQTCVDDVITVSNDEVCAAIQDIFEDTRAMSEPAGALALAGLKRYVATHGVSNQTLIAVVSGANISFSRFQHIAERAEIGEGKEALLAVKIPEKPGSFNTFCKAVGTRGITEFNYRYHRDDQAVVFVGVETQGKPITPLIDHLSSHGFGVSNLSDNEIAKVHIRHMVGGPQSVPNERLFYFEFPERPGALLNFLNKIGSERNITLFHYRNHGADYGRVLIGIQVRPEEQPLFHETLSKIGYPFRDESQNIVVELFLR